MDNLNKSMGALKKLLNEASEEDLARWREILIKNETPKGWISIEKHLPQMKAKDIIQGYSVYKCRDSKGVETYTTVSDHNSWYYFALGNDIKEWFNE